MPIEFAAPPSAVDHDYTLKVAEQALERIKALTLPADPAGFELWYNYVLGTNAKLNEHINHIVNEKGRLTPADLEEIYHKHLPARRISNAVDDVGTRISTEVDKVVGLLSELVLSTVQTRNESIHAVNHLTGTDDGDTVRTIAKSLIHSLRAIEARCDALEVQLKTSQVEVAHARQTVAELAAQANTDSVTGLANRRGFDNALKRHTEHAESSGRPLALLMIDIDHFKAFNDRFGHLMGDTVLRLISVTLKQSIQRSDFAARHGGEEFAVILPDTKLNDAVHSAEHIRKKIMGRELKQRSTGSTLGSITVSIGVSALNKGETERDLFHRADINLYEAKRSGRNCTRYDSKANVPLRA